MEEAQRVAEGKGQRTHKRIVVTDGEIEILKFIHDYRLLRIEQIEPVNGRTYPSVHRRLKSLFDADFLKRIEIPQKEDVYHVGRPALALLLSHGLITDDRVSDQTVGDILRRFRVPRAPKHRRQMSWSDFIRSHMAVLAGVDFFTVEVLTWVAWQLNLCAFFLHLETRRVTLAGITQHPTEEWMVQMLAELRMTSTAPYSRFVCSA